MGKGLLIVLVLIIIAADLFVFFSNFDSMDNFLGSVISEPKEEKVVTKIIDGDTVVVEGGINVRFLGIDCDERGKECYTPAKNRIEELLLNEVVVLESDDEDVDQYKRKLRYIFLNGENINLRMVEEGYCVARFEGKTNAKYQEEIIQAEKNAIDNKIGCKWG